MDSFQAEKELVRDYHSALDTADVSKLVDVIDSHTTSDYRWRGYHPFNKLRGAAAVATQFWRPLRRSLTSLQRRQDVFFAGHNEMDRFESVWVVSMGHLTGLFDTPWLGIAATGKMAFLRYCEFNRVEDGKIAETALYFDIPHLAAQAGLTLFPEQTAAHLVQPGPMTHDGLLFDAQPPEIGEKTLATINAMISDLGQWDSKLTLEQELRQTWVEDMIWWGPEGIGATYTIPRYAQQHSGPFRAAFSDRTKTTHIARLAEGHYGGFFGWPNFQATLSGAFMGRAASGMRSEFRVIDIYRRAGDKLAENWVFIDLLHFWKQQGIDILADLTQ